MLESKPKYVSDAQMNEPSFLNTSSYRKVKLSVVQLQHLTGDYSDKLSGIDLNRLLELHESLTMKLQNALS